jgi:hypothetical protein
LPLFVFFFFPRIYLLSLFGAIVAAFQLVLEMSSGLPPGKKIKISMAESVKNREKKSK